MPATFVVDGRSVIDLPPQARRIGLVFQDYAVFSRLTVAREPRLRARSAQGARGPSGDGRVGAGREARP